MKLFGLFIPTFNKGTLVMVTDTSCAKGEQAELIFKYLDPKKQYKHNLYLVPKRKSLGKVVSRMKYTDAAGQSAIYYGVLIKDLLFAIEENGLTKA